MILLGERIAVKKVERESSIIVPENIKVEEITEGEVVAIGNRVGAESGCGELRVGDKVQWSVYAGQWAKIEGQVLCILRANDIICKI